MFTAQDIFDYEDKLDRLLFSYYVNCNHNDARPAEKMWEFERNLMLTWEKEMKKFNVDCVYGLPKKVYNDMCLKLGREALQIWEEVNSETKLQSIEHNIVKLKILFFARNNDLIKRAIKEKK